MLLSIHLKVTVPLLLTVINTSFVNAKTRQRHQNLQRSQNLKNLSGIYKSGQDATKFFESLQRIVKFCNDIKDDLDLDLAFGLFLANVNLYTVQRLYKLKEKEAKEFKILTARIEQLLYLFKMKVVNPAYNKEKSHIELLLWDAPERWVDRMVILTPNPSRLDLTTGLTGLDQFASWDEYMDAVFSAKETNVPTKEQADRCVARLLSNQVTLIGTQSMCTLDRDCVDIVQNGTDYGYPLLQRIVVMMLAQLSRGCSVISPAEDLKITTNLCRSSYHEAKFVEFFGFETIHRLAEQMIFCATLGYVHILQRSWLDLILKYQVPRGCFGLKVYGQHEHRPRLRAEEMIESRRLDDDIAGGNCSRHMTGMAAAVLAAQVKLYHDIQHR